MSVVDVSAARGRCISIVVTVHTITLCVVVCLHVVEWLHILVSLHLHVLSIARYLRDHGTALAAMVPHVLIYWVLSHWSAMSRCDHLRLLMVVRLMM